MCGFDVPGPLRRGEPFLWLNPEKQPFAACAEDFPFAADAVEDAAARLERFAPVISRLFPETRAAGGIIESELRPAPALREALNADLGSELRGGLYLKLDSHLPVSGSVKARGGIYEVLRHTEAVALEAGILRDPHDDHMKLLTPAARAVFGARRLQVGSTGNLGMSIGIMGAALGFRAVVHMSADAKQWKKALLRARGATVVEYDGDYGAAVARGRAESEADPCSYFVDDESSKDLFLGYAVAGERLARQLRDLRVAVDEARPLFVYLPCGVGGAPGGVTYGLKRIFGDDVQCFFAEPTGAPCMTLGLASGLLNGICVQDIGLSGKTEADGLAVGRCSPLVSRAMRRTVSGAATVPDDALYRFLALVRRTQGVTLEPSAAAGLGALTALLTDPAGAAYRERAGGPGATHIVWATGGGMAPECVRAQWLSRR